MQARTPLIRSRRGRLTALAAAGASLLGALAAAPVASAGEYQFFSCSDFVGRHLPTEDFKYQSVGLGHGDNKCGTQGYHHLTLPGTDMNGGQWTGFGLRVPDGSGLRIKYITATRQLVIYGGSDYDWGATSAYKFEWGNDSNSTYGVNTTREEWCELTQPCGGFGWPEVNSGSDQFKHDFLGGGATFIGFSLACQNNPGMSGWCSGSGGAGRGKLLLGRTQLKMVDNNQPQMSAPAGSLLAPGARSGNETLTFTANDSGAGVYEAILTVDGREVQRIKPQSSPSSCNDAGNVPELDFTRLQPCLTTAAVSFNLSTTAFSEGKHRITAQVRDAAGNLSGQTVHDVVLDNIPAPIAKTAPTVAASSYTVGQTAQASPGDWQGAALKMDYQWQRSTDGTNWSSIPLENALTYRLSEADVNSYVRILVTAANTEGTTATPSILPPTRVQKVAGLGGVPEPGKPGSGSPGGSSEAPKSGPNGSGGQLSSGRLVMTNKSGKRRASAGRTITIKGRLRDSAKKAIVGARVDVFETRGLPGAARARVGEVQTDAKGDYIYKFKAYGNSRLEFAYATSGEYVDRQTVDLRVMATIKLKVKRTLQVKTKVRIEGRLIGGPLPQRGATIMIKAFDSATGSFRRAGEVQTRPDGTFRYLRKLDFRGRYRFRAELVPTKDVPLVKALSAHKDVLAR